MSARLFESGDAEQVASLIRETLLTSNAADYPLDELESLADWYGPSGLVSRMPFCTRLVAVDDTTGACIGTIARRENHIEGFFVRPAWQKRGIGAFLLSGVEADAHMHGIQAIWLESSITAQGFYRACGFTAVSGVEDLGEGPCITMRKHL